jgi:hypothetical protein
MKFNLQSQTLKKLQIYGIWLFVQWISMLEIRFLSFREKTTLKLTTHKKHIRNNKRNCIIYKIICYVMHDKKVIWFYEVCPDTDALGNIFRFILQNMFFFLWKLYSRHQKTSKLFHHVLIIYWSNTMHYQHSALQFPGPFEVEDPALATSLL